MKEQIYFYERAENHKVKEQTFKSFKRANFPGKHEDVDQEFLERGFICIEVWGSALLFLSLLS